MIILGFNMNPITQSASTIKTKAILVRWMGGANLNIAAIEMARLIVEASNKAYEEGYCAGESRVAEDRLLQFE
jgi:hypothetical protein